MKLSKEAKKAVMLGTLCSVSYFAVYIARNIMGAVSPGMIESGLFTEESIGSISSTYFFFYAFGQLINGSIGDRIKARYMISIGLFMAGITNLIFSQIAGLSSFAPFVYGMTGFFLAMIYGPMTKAVAENTEPIFATRCSLGFTFASFVGSPMAGVLATFMIWRGVFAFSGVALCVMAIAAFVAFWIFEKKGIVRYGQFRIEKTSEKKGGDIGEKLKLLIRRRIIKFTLISVLTGIVRTSVTFWLSTYIAQRLDFSPEAAASIFTVATFVISFTAFISVFVYERLKC
ncbi:MAG: MFS transporter, partial [Clostridia bacterium]|nr:MFS transporter [Clostridia bacterium]